MKKFISAVCVFAAVAVSAGMDLPARSFTVQKEGASRIVRGEDFFDRALLLTSGKDQAVTAVFKQKFLPISAEYEIKADIRGRGRAFIELRLLNADGTVTVKRLASAEATDRFRDIEGKFDLHYFRTEKRVSRLEIVLGVEKDSSIVFNDIELDIDRD